MTGFNIQRNINRNTSLSEYRVYLSKVLTLRFEVTLRYMYFLPQNENGHIPLPLLLGYCVVKTIEQLKRPIVF